MINTNVLTLDDCILPPSEWHRKEDGSLYSVEELKKIIPEWKLRECQCDSTHKINRQKAELYFNYEYDEEKLDAYLEKNYQNNFEKKLDYSTAGLIKMFNDGLIVSPAFVNWNNMYTPSWNSYSSYYRWIEALIPCIKSVQTRFDILSYLKKTYKTLDTDSYTNRKGIAVINALLVDAKEALKVEKAEAAAKKKAQQKSTTQKPTPEYSLSLDEIIAYANGEGKAHAEAIRSMLRYFKDEKEGWDNAKVKKQIHDILLPDSHTVNIAQQTNTGCQQFAHVTDSTFQK